MSVRTDWQRAAETDGRAFDCESVTSRVLLEHGPPEEDDVSQGNFISYSTQVIAEAELNTKAFLYRPEH